MRAEIPARFLTDYNREIIEQEGQSNRMACTGNSKSSLPGIHFSSNAIQQVSHRLSEMGESAQQLKQRKRTAEKISHE